MVDQLLVSGPLRLELLHGGGVDNGTASPELMDMDIDHAYPPRSPAPCDMSLDETTRKRKQIEAASKKSSRAKVLKLADKTSNLRAITASPPPDWSVKRRVEYVTWARDVVAGLRDVNEGLEAAFDEAASAAEESVRP